MAVEPKITPKPTPNKQKKRKQRPPATHTKENDEKYAPARCDIPGVGIYMHQIPEYGLDSAEDGET